MFSIILKVTGKMKKDLKLFNSERARTPLCKENTLASFRKFGYIHLSTKTIINVTQW